MLNIPCCGMFVMCICGDVHAVNTVWGNGIVPDSFIQQTGPKNTCAFSGKHSSTVLSSILSDAGFHPAPL